jgi:hypothetical protein
MVSEFPYFFHTAEPILSVMGFMGMKASNARLGYTQPLHFALLYLFRDVLGNKH